MVHLQKDYETIQQLGAEVLVVFREDKKEVAGLAITAKKSGAKFNLLTDLGAKSTASYLGEGQTFCTYVIDKEGKVREVLTGNKFVRPNAEAVIKALKKHNQTP